MDPTRAYVPWTRNEPFPRGRITTTSGEPDAPGVAAGLIDAETGELTVGCVDDVGAVVTDDVQAAAATSNAATPRDLGREPTARR